MIEHKKHMSKTTLGTTGAVPNLPLPVTHPIPWCKERSKQELTAEVQCAFFSLYPHKRNMRQHSNLIEIRSITITCWGALENSNSIFKPNLTYITERRLIKSSFDLLYFLRKRQSLTVAPKAKQAVKK